jgi:ABC-type sugar transport system permease subunit
MTFSDNIANFFNLPTLGSGLTWGSMVHAAGRLYITTRGGPGDSMMVLQVRGYQEAILYTNFSVGLTYTIVIWAAVFIATRLLVGVFGRAQARASGP